MKTDRNTMACSLRSLPDDIVITFFAANPRLVVGCKATLRLFRDSAWDKSPKHVLEYLLNAVGRTSFRDVAEHPLFDATNKKQWALEFVRRRQCVTEDDLAAILKIDAMSVAVLEQVAPSSATLGCLLTRACCWACSDVALLDWLLCRAQNFSHRACLMFACTCNANVAVKMLLDRLPISDEIVNDAIGYVCCNCHAFSSMETLRLLISSRPHLRADIFAKQLVWIANKHSAAALDVLVEYGAAMNAHDALRNLAITHESFDEEIVERMMGVLLGHGASAVPALFAICSSSNSDVIVASRVRTLVRSRNLSDLTAYELLMQLVAKDRRGEAVAAFLESRPQTDLNIGIRNGKTALMACRTASCARVLIGHGADPRIKDQYGDTVLIHACQNYNNCHDLLGFLEFLLGLDLGDSAGVDVVHDNKCALLCACFMPNYLAQAVAQLLLGPIGRGDPNVLLRDGDTVLTRMWQCAGGWQNVSGLLRTLVYHGADVNHRRLRDGQTALHRAAMMACDDTDSICLLLDAGADVNAIDHDGNTPLHLACECRIRPRGSRILALLRYGADAEARNLKGELPRIHDAMIVV